MKFIYALLTLILVTIMGNAQNGIYVKYELDTKASTEDVDMAEYVVKIPEGVEIQPLKELKAMGTGF